MDSCSFMKECVICHKPFDYRDRGGKNTKTCSDKCSRKHTGNLRKKAQVAWKERERKKMCKK